MQYQKSTNWGVCKPVGQICGQFQHICLERVHNTKGITTPSFRVIPKSTSPCYFKRPASLGLAIVITSIFGKGFHRVGCPITLLPPWKSFQINNFNFFSIYDWFTLYITCSTPSTLGVVFVSAILKIYKLRGMQTCRPSLWPLSAHLSGKSALHKRYYNPIIQLCQRPLDHATLKGLRVWVWHLD